MPADPNPNLMKLTPQERETIIAQLREEAIEQLRRLGCTCQPEPQLELTEGTIGPYDLPAWMSSHPEGCPAAKVGRQLKDEAQGDLPVIFMPR